MSGPADPLILDGRLFVAYRPHGSDRMGRISGQAGRLGLRARLSLPMRPGGTVTTWSALDEYAALVADLRGGDWLDAGILDALAAYGHGSAYAAFAEDRRGRCASGAKRTWWCLTGTSSRVDPRRSSARPSP